MCLEIISNLKQIAILEGINNPMLSNTKFTQTGVKSHSYAVLAISTGRELQR